MSGLGLNPFMFYFLFNSRADNQPIRVEMSVEAKSPTLQKNFLNTAIAWNKP